MSIQIYHSNLLTFAHSLFLVPSSLWPVYPLKKNCNTLLSLGSKGSGTQLSLWQHGGEFTLSSYSSQGLSASLLSSFLFPAALTEWTILRAGLTMVVVVVVVALLLLLLHCIVISPSHLFFLPLFLVPSSFHSPFHPSSSEKGWPPMDIILPWYIMLQYDWVNLVLLWLGKASQLGERDQRQAAVRESLDSCC